MRNVLVCAAHVIMSLHLGSVASCGTAAHTASTHASRFRCLLIASWAQLALQVAKQQGQYLAKLLRAGIAPGKLPEGVEPFKYSHKGSLAYVGAACSSPHPQNLLKRLDSLRVVQI